MNDEAARTGPNPFSFASFPGFFPLMFAVPVFLATPLLGAFA